VPIRLVRSDDLLERVLRLEPAPSWLDSDTGDEAEIVELAIISDAPRLHSGFARIVGPYTARAFEDRTNLRLTDACCFRVSIGGAPEREQGPHLALREFPVDNAQFKIERFAQAVLRTPQPACVADVAGTHRYLQRCDGVWGNHVKRTLRTRSIEIFHFIFSCVADVALSVSSGVKRGMAYAG